MSVLLLAKTADRRGAPLRLLSKRSAGGEAAACAFPTSSETRRAPLRREKLCVDRAGSALSSDGGVRESVKYENLAKAAVRSF